MQTSDLSGVELLACDFDGVLTTNTVYVSQDGKEMVRCWRGDGLGIERLGQMGIATIVFTGEPFGVVDARCKKLGVRVAHCVDVPKLDVLKTILEYGAGHGITLEQVAYLGNDTNDRECLETVGHPFVVRDAHPSLQRFPHTRARGGAGAVRELCDLIADAIEGIRGDFRRTLADTRRYWDARLAERDNNYDLFLAESG